MQHPASAIQQQLYVAAQEGHAAGALRGGLWTLGPDARAPGDPRKRTLVREWHDRVETVEEANLLTEEFAAFLTALREGSNELYQPKARVLFRTRPRGRRTKA